MQRTAMRLVMFNEVMIMISCYHLFTFSRAVDFKFNHIAGYSYAINIGFLVTVNVGVMIWKAIEKHRRNLRMKKAQKAYRESLK